MKIKERGLMRDFIAAAAQASGNRRVAVRAVLALRKWFGGQLVYVPLVRQDGKTADALRGVLADAVGDEMAEKILRKFMCLFGGEQLYIPKGIGALREELAQEIYERFDSSQETMNSLCREYNISYTQIYRLYYLGRDEKAQMHFDFDRSKEDDELVL